MTDPENYSGALPGLELSDLTASGQTGGDATSDGKVDNITDWALEHFTSHYPNETITKDDIWHYIYGVLHAQDWRDKYANELRKNLPRIPMAPQFTPFCDAGATLMELHLNYETIKPWPLNVELDNQTYDGATLTTNTLPNAETYRIRPKMRWGKLPDAKGSGRKTEDRTVLRVNDRCRIIGIPSVAGNPYSDPTETNRQLIAGDNTSHLDPYIVNGKTPLEWAIARLQITTAKESGIVNDANKWHVWADDENAHELVLHLLRLVRVSIETSQTVDALPPSLPPDLGN